MRPTDCERVKPLLQDPHEERFSLSERRELEAHVQVCASCRAELAAERALTEALHTRLERPAAPDALRLRIAALALDVAVASVTSERGEHPTPALAARARRWRPYAIAGLSGAALAGAAALILMLGSPRGPAAAAPLVLEAVNDHLRVLYAAHPLEVERGGMHQVRPWFTGRLDFAPVLRFDGDADFELSGGSVGYFIDRKAAIFVFKHRLHTVSLLEFRGEGVPWPHSASSVTNVRARDSERLRGFNVLYWREGDLGFALVSDAEPATLQRLADKLQTPH